MKSYLFLLVTRDGSDVFALREIPPQYRIGAASLAVGGKLSVPNGTLYSVDAARDIPVVDFAALCESEAL